MSWSEVIPCEGDRGQFKGPTYAEVGRIRTHSDTKGSEVLAILLLSLAGEHLGKESNRVDSEVERVNVMLGKVCIERSNK